MRNFALIRRWNFVVGLMPLWLAPNLITIIGLAINVFTASVHLYFCPTATEEVVVETRFSRRSQWPLILISGAELGAVELRFGTFRLSNVGCHWWQTSPKNGEFQCSRRTFRSWLWQYEHYFRHAHRSLYNGHGTFTLLDDVWMLYSFGSLLFGSLANLRHWPDAIRKVRCDGSTNYHDVSHAHFCIVWHKLLELATLWLSTFTLVAVDFRHPS